MACMDAMTAYWKENTQMIDPSPDEKDAMKCGGKLGGEYLESIGQTDLKLLASDQWEAFLQAVIEGYTERLRDLREIPF